MMAILAFFLGFTGGFFIASLMRASEGEDDE